MSRRADLRAIIRGKCISDAATDAAVEALMEYLAVPCGYGCAEPCHPGEHKDSDPARFVEALAERVHRLYDGVPAGQAVAAETAVRGALDRHYPRLLDGKSHATGHQCETTDDCVADITASALAARGDAARLRRA